MRRPLSVLVTIGLTAAMTAGAAGVGAADEPAPAYDVRSGATTPALGRAADAERLVSATATFSAANRATGMPTSTQPHHQLVMPGGSLSVTVEYGYHWQTGALTYDYSLDTRFVDVDGSAATVVRLGFGAFQGTTCMIEEMTEARAYSSIPDVLLYDNKDTDDLASAAGWDCSALVIGSRDPAATPYDAFVSELAVTTATPELTLHAPGRDRLVRGVWTRIPVRVTNASPEAIAARDVVVTGQGKGVKVRPAEIGEIRGQDDSEADVWVKLTKPKAKLRLTVSELGETLDRATVRATARPAPAPPRAGSWSSTNGVDFTVRGGKVRGFRITTRTTCGGYPDLPTTTQNTYDFPTVRIPRNNEVVESDSGNEGGNAEYSVHLELEFVSPRKVKGHFAYYGPARCVATEGFTAKPGR